MYETKKTEAEPQKKDRNEERMIRILSTDIPGSKKIFVGLTMIRGVSWSFANALCSVLEIDKNREAGSLSKEEIEKVSGFIKKPGMPEFLLNRRKDRGSGESYHLTGSDLELQKELDIKRLKKIRSYRGWRHAFGQPTRGQRTKSHFRKQGKKRAVGVMNKPKAGKK